MFKITYVDTILNPLIKRGNLNVKLSVRITEKRLTLFTAIPLRIGMPFSTFELVIKSCRASASSTNVKMDQTLDSK